MPDVAGPHQSSTGVVLSVMRLLLLVGLFACSPPEEPEPESVATDSVWSDPYIGSDPTVPFWPDTQAIYWRYAFDPPSRSHAVRLQGRLEAARYAGFDCYDDGARTPVTNVRDTDLLFDDGAPWEGGEGSFTVWLAHEASDYEGLDNVCVMPSGLERWSVFQRLYLSERPADAIELPAVDLVELSTQQAEPPPSASPVTVVSQTLIDALIARAAVPERDEVYFYRLAADGTYPTADNNYLIAQVERAPGQVLVLRWDAPQAASSADSQAPVRYWSLSQGDWSSFTQRSDYDAQLGGSGSITLAIGDSDSEAAAATRGHRFSPWQAPDRAWFIYRNMVETHTPTFLDVPAYDFDLPPEGQEARLVLGDAAPHGVLCDAAAYADGSCGGDAR